MPAEAVVVQACRACEKIDSEVVQTFRSARHGRPEGLHYDQQARACLTAIFPHDIRMIFSRLRMLQALCGLGWRSIQDVPNLSLSIAKREAKNVSCIGMKI